MSPETRTAPVRNAVEGDRRPLARPRRVGRAHVMLEGGGQGGMRGRERRRGMNASVPSQT